MTVFVAVVLVLVLGIVSFTKMTPDLMPNMDLPYALVLTPYVGQTPETVETVVTKPLEQSVAVIDGVKRIRSSSNDSYSMCVIEFLDGTDMNTAGNDVRAALDTLSDGWDEAVGSPVLIKINPNILPVAMMAVDYEGKDRRDISGFVSDTLTDRLKGIDGVASVSDMGVVVERENVVISQTKLDALNKKIDTALDSQFAEAQGKLEEAKSELESNLSQATEGAAVITDSIGAINARQEALAAQLAEAQAEADNGRSKLLSAKMEMLDQKTVLATTKQVLETTYKALLNVKTTYEELLAEKNELVEKLDTLNSINEQYMDILSKLLAPGTDAAQREQLREQLAEIDRQLEPYGIKKEGLAVAIAAANAALKRVDSSIEEVNKKLAELGTDTGMLDETLKTVSDRIGQINSGMEQLDTALKGLDDNSVTVNEALATIAQQQSSADFKMGGALAELTAKQSEVSAAAAQLTAAQSELEKNLSELSDQKEQAKKKANPDSLVTIETVSGILAAQNFSMPAGYVTDEDNTRYLVRVGDEVADEKELTALPLFDTEIDGIGVISLCDVADVFVADNSDEIYAKVNGSDGVILSFTKQSDVATAAVCDRISEAAASLEKEYEGLHFTVIYSQGDYIRLIVNGVLQNLLMGAALAIIILLLFLRDIKPTVIVAVSIPVSVIFAIVLMYFSGISLNMFSLSGLAIGVGMLVDNSVVVIENIYRLRSEGLSPVKAALRGARQVAGAIIASTLTTVCVFFPIVFVEGLTRQLFMDMALTITYSLGASLLTALTLVPAMSSRMLRRVHRPKHMRESRILVKYESSLRFVLRHKVIAVLAVIALLFGSGALVLLRGFSFLPSMSDTDVQVSVSLPPNTTFDKTVEAAEQVNAVLREYDEFETVGVIVGSASGVMGIGMGDMSGSGSGAGSVTGYGVLKSEFTKRGREIGKEIESKLDIDGTITVSADASSSMSTLLGDGSVQITLCGDDLRQLQATAVDMAEKLRSMEGVESADSGVGSTSPELKVTVDRGKAAENGLTTAQIFREIASALAAEKTSTTLKTENGRLIDIVAVKDEEQKVTADKLGSIEMTCTDIQGNEKKVKLSDVAAIEKGETMNSISRIDQKRTLTVSATVKEGYSLTDVSNRAKALFRDYELPKGFSIAFEGTDKETMDALAQLLLMLLLGVIMIYLVMVAQFRSLKSPFIIMFTIPLAFTGGFLGLLFTGFDVSVVSLVGFIMLCGIIVNNGIVLVDYINVLRLAGKERIDAIVEAGKTRMRPILITALTTVLGLSVMALGIGTGAEMMQPLAVVCIGGLLYATLMTLFIIPLIYDAFNKKQRDAAPGAPINTFTVS